MSSLAPIFSIIIPTRNRCKMLLVCIKSVQQQKFADWELIIVDDGSTDNTKREVEKIEDEKIRYCLCKHKERSNARNVGIALAKGRYLCFVDDDDTISEDYLFDFWSYYEANEFPSILLRTGYIKSIGKTKLPSKNYDIVSHRNPIRFATFNMCGVWSFCIPSKFMESDKFSVQFPHWQDTHLILRLLLKHELVQLDSHNYNYHIHDEMGSKLAFSHFDPVERADLNVDAFVDLFCNFSEELSVYLPKSTLKFLKAEKYIEYANNTLRLRNPKHSILFRKSLKNGLYVRLWKHYIIFLKLKMRF